MRLIDADAFDERVRAAGGMSEEELTEDFKDGVQAVLYMLSNQPTIQPEPHWIPVDLKNNEPPLEEWVLVSSDGYVMQDCIVERGGKKIWYHGGNIQSDDRYMPLPEPYKGVTT
jgi:hypothetical protein